MKNNILASTLLSVIDTADLRQQAAPFQAKA